MDWHDKASEQHKKSEETRYLLHGTKKETHPTHPVQLQSSQLMTTKSTALLMTRWVLIISNAVGF